MVNGDTFLKVGSQKQLFASWPVRLMYFLASLASDSSSGTASAMANSMPSGALERLQEGRAGRL